MERFLFYRQNQARGESIAEFVAELRKLSTHCNFKDNQLEEALRDRLVCGLQSVATQQHLLTEAILTFATMCSALDNEQDNPGLSHVVVLNENHKH